ncbi:MAG: ATPase [Bacillota bacterium]|nr:ATPase [Candidatus Fermentithermobacillaceae bacterium]
MDVLALLDKLDAYLSECSRVPLMGKLLVDEEEVFAIIDDLRAQLPQELEQAKWLLKERERILQEARKESEEIVKDAQGQIATLASESVIAKEARVQAEELMARAKEVAKEINLGAREYADELMKAVEDAITETLERVRQGRRELAVDREPASRPADPFDDEGPFDEDADDSFFIEAEDDEEPSREVKRRRK